MRLTHTILALFLLTVGCNKTESQNISSAIENVDAIKFKKLIQFGNGIILDVRTPEEVLQGKIESASTVNLYDKDFSSKINLMQKDKSIFVYCRSGARSSQAAEILRKNGFGKIYNLKGGITAWENNGFAVIKTQNSVDEKIKAMSLPEFKDLLKTDKPVLVDFHTKWCSPCIQMAPIVDRIAEKMKNKASVLRVDIDKSEDIRDTYKIEGVPVFILFKNGKEIWRKSGIISEEKLTADILK